MKVRDINDANEKKTYFQFPNTNAFRFFLERTLQPKRLRSACSERTKFKQYILFWIIGCCVRCISIVRNKPNKSSNNISKWKHTPPARWDTSLDVSDARGRTKTRWKPLNCVLMFVQFKLWIFYSFSFLTIMFLAFRGPRGTQNAWKQ